MKKVLALVLAAIMVLGISSAFADKTPLTLWSIAVEGDSNRAAYLAAVDAFNAANSDFEMTMEPTENEAYKTKIKAAMSAGTDLPDIFFTWSMSFLGDFVKAGRVLCLDDVLPEYKDKLTDTVLANTTYDGKHYGVPLTMNVVTMFANMDLLKEVGCEEVPTTYDELIEVCKALKEKDIIPFGVSGKENWCLSEYTEPLLAKTIGSEGLKKCYTGEESWDQPGVITAMEKFVELKKYIDPNAAALGNEEVKQAFIDGKYAFYQNGSWNCGDISDKAKFTAGKKSWSIPVDIALPCAFQNELSEEDAKELKANGCWCCCEVSNMGCQPGAIHFFQHNGILFAPGKAVNAGGVATSGLEMTQNAEHISWSGEEVDEKLHFIMKSIHEQCVKYGTQPDGSVDYVKGANIAGFMKVATAMLEQGTI